MNAPARPLGAVGRAKPSLRDVPMLFSGQLRPSRLDVTVTNRQRLLKINTPLLKKIARHVLADLGVTGGSLSIALVDDGAMAKLNAQYHHVEGPTDILTFDYGAGAGELIISVEHAQSQAKQFRSTPSRELPLYIIHGLLHLHGHDDLKPRPRARMRAAERRLLALLEKAFPLRKLITP